MAVLSCLVAVSGSVVSARLRAAETKTGMKTSPVGLWEVVKMDFTGKPNSKFTGGEFMIAKNGTGWRRIRGGRKVTFKFICKLHDKKNRLYRFTIAGSEDDVSAGGGGPRKGILRITDKGEIEMLETTSAIDDYPKDFSAPSLKANKFWKLKPKKRK